MRRLRKPLNVETPVRMATFRLSKKPDCLNQVAGRLSYQEAQISIPTTAPQPAELHSVGRARTTHTPSRNLHQSVAAKL